MTTAPYLPAAEALIGTSHEQRVTLELTAGEQTWTTALLGGDLTLSEDWSPRAMLTAAIPNIFTLADLAALDPRNQAVTAVVKAGYVHPDGTVDVHTLFTGHLRSRRVNRPSNTVQLQASSAELLAQDAGYMDTTEFLTFPGVTEALEWFASYATGATVTIDSSLGYEYRADLTSSIPVAAGTDVWQFMADLALAADVRLFVDVDGGWKITAKATDADDLNTTSLAGNVSDSEDVLERDGYYSAAVLKYQWRDALGVDHTIYGMYGTVPGKVYYGTLDTSTTQAAADAAAQATVRNLSTRGDSYVCTSVAAYWLRPASTVRVTLASGVDVSHLVKQVVFHFTAGTMTTTTRQPSNLGD